MTGVWVKVCGITTREAAQAAVEAGADALGFVFLDSARRVTAEAATRIGAGLDAERVALVEGDVRDALQILEAIDATGVQPYGKSAAEIASRATDAGYLVLRPVAVRPGFELEFARVPVDQLPLLDTHDPDRPGGTGRTFDWGWAATLERPFVVAGGLGPDNVAAVLARLRPWGLDASSRLESRPGLKDPALVRSFVTSAKQRVP